MESLVVLVGITRTLQELTLHHMAVGTSGILMHIRMVHQPPILRLLCHHDVMRVLMPAGV